MKFIPTLLLISVCVHHGLVGQQITFHQLPQNLQLFPRDAQNIAYIPISGKMHAGTPGAISVNIKKNNSHYSYVKTALKTAGDFSLRIPIRAELAEYHLDVYWLNGKDSTFLARRENIVAGDVFLVSGQSNSYTGKDHPKVYKGKFARSFGRNPDYENYAPYHAADTLWSISNSPSDVGLFASELQRLLIEKQKIPICIINGGSGGSSMEYNLFRSANPVDLKTSSGKLLYRSQKAGVTNQVKAFIYRQGENETSGNAPEWLANFKKHADLLKKEYPSIQKIYLPQINILHGELSIQSVIRDGQRSITQTDTFIRGFATIGTKGYDGIHYSPEGYAQTAAELYRLLEADLYRPETNPQIESPNIQRAYFASKDKKKIILAFDKGQKLRIPADSTVTDWNGNKLTQSLKNNFFFAPIAFPHANFTELVRIEAKDNELTLLLSKPPTTDTLAYTPSFYNHPKGYQIAAPLLTNQTGMRAFAFDHFLIEPYDNYFDDDADGYVNAKDQCPNTSPNNPVDKNGCASDQRDSDADGLLDNVDDCPFEKQLPIPQINNVSENILTTSPAGSYQWFQNGTIMPGEVKQNLTVMVSGTYAVEIKSAAGCMVPRSATKQVLILGNEEERSSIRIFPNPAQDYIQIEFDKKIYPSLQVQLIDLQGRIWWGKVEFQTKDQIPLSQVPVGNYVVKFSHGLKSIKVQKQ